MDDIGAGAPHRRRGGRFRLRRFLAAAAATLAGATGVIVATPELASAAVVVQFSDSNNQHFPEGAGENVDGFCRQNGPNAWVDSCRVEIWSGGSMVAAHDIPVAFHVNIVSFGVPFVTSPAGSYTVIVRVSGTGGGANTGFLNYYVDSVGPPPPAPPSATITAPGGGTTVNPNAFLSLQGYCTPGGLPLANCYAQVWGPTGYHDLHAGDQLPTWASGDFYVRLTASDGTTEVSTDTSYHVNIPPGLSVSGVFNGQVINEGDVVPFSRYCYSNEPVSVSCDESMTFPDGHTQAWGLPNLPNADYGWHVHRLTAVDGNGLSSSLDTSFRVNALPHASITAPVNGDRYYTGDGHPSVYSCSDLEGLVSCNGNVANGANVDTSVAGPKTFTVTATDSDGASRQASTGYTVYDRPVAHLDGPLAGTVINPGDPAPVFDGRCTGGMPAVTCTMTVERPGWGPVPLVDGQVLPIDTYATYLIRVHIVDDLGTESEVVRTYKVNEPPHVNVDVPIVEHETFVGQDLATVFDCYDNDGTVVTCDGESSPIAISTDVPGHYEYEVTAVDNDGASTTVQIPYEVHPVVGPCRGRGLALLGGNFGDANPASDPCASASVKTTSLNQIIGPPVQPNPNPLQRLLGQVLAPLTNTVKAGVIEGRTVRTAPATFHASADIASAQINIIAGVNIEVTGVHSEVTSRLTSCSTAEVSGVSRLGTIKLNGVPLVIGQQPVTVPLLGLGTLYLNQRVTSQTGITQRALFLDLAGTALDVIVGESTVNPYCG